MSRLVEHDAQGPRKLTEDDIDPEKGDVAICQCGLADSYPFCDGSHRRTEDEDADAVYDYDVDDADRRPVAEIVHADEE
ncbi:CDGSH iron-sulfur domain-containing protein [Natrialbaceae archaeon AArc-T1-2]|uniref:CDGSH iron-sulfur domain-containing protein n=1 Tax=Natrialbaceae archaeon AArc-T1-2 TaxID=3053904 RepID=UPI00255AA0E2|nr:CDGSH iron-sulfur domain-containing protein [Natrialbaceae archaeon AArc-T1-2]WIV66294.1 CDGSH iron-sulfur domain-containing protein [Natrialbaceae archaeon AArc-T1-2]